MNDLTTIIAAEADRYELLRSQSERLPVPLTPAELIEKGGKLADLAHEIDGLEDQKASTAKGYAEQIKRRRLDLTEIGEVVREKAERRPVQVHVVMDWVEGIVRHMRTDTGEIIQERAATLEERQKGLKLARGEGS